MRRIDNYRGDLKRCLNCDTFKNWGDFHLRQKGDVQFPTSYCKDCCAKKNLEYRLANVDKIRDSELNTTYGISLKEYSELLIKQNNNCAICQTPQSKLKTKLCIDHCHETGKVRGLLCHTCNRALGLLKDNTNILKEAIKYLDKERIEEYNRGIKENK